jgi:hypothetical protein
VQYGKASKKFHSRVRAETSVTDEPTLEIEGLPATRVAVVAKPKVVTDGNHKTEDTEQESPVKASFKIKTDLAAMSLIQGMLAS